MAIIYKNMWENGDKMEYLAKFGYKPAMTYEFLKSTCCYIYL
jgi:hypothetical protein